MAINRLALIAGNDLPYRSARTTIHIPTLEEIGFIGETNFYTGCELWRFSKDNLTSQDKKDLENLSNFDIIMSILNDKNNSSSKSGSAYAISILSLMFPDYEVIVNLKDITLLRKDSEGKIISKVDINNKTFDELRAVMIVAFCLNGQKGNEEDFKPSGELAQHIADKIKKGKAKVAKLKGQEEIDILSRYMSILAVGEQKDLNILKKYTIYQLFDEFTRYTLENESDWYRLARIQGASGMKEPKNWMDNIYKIEEDELRNGSL